MIYLNVIAKKDCTMILIIDNDKGSAQAIADIFSFMGIISRAATPTEALKEISLKYKAVILHRPEYMPDAEAMARIILSQYNMPIFTVSSNRGMYEKCKLFTKNYDCNTEMTKTAESIVSTVSQVLDIEFGYYRTAGIEIAPRHGRTTMLGVPIPLTKTETAIMRYLILTYPIPQSAKDIIKYAFKPSKQPELTSIRTHLSLMNKKFKSVISRNIIISIQEKGYVISTPEILQSLADGNLS